MNDNNWFLLTTSSVMGVGFHAFKGKGHLFKPGAEVLIQAEPDNEYDQYAIGVWCKTELLGAPVVPAGQAGVAGFPAWSRFGFLPKGNAMLSRLLQGGHNMRAEIRPDPSGVNPTVDLYLKKGNDK